MLLPPVTPCSKLVLQRCSAGLSMKTLLLRSRSELDQSPPLRLLRPLPASIDPHSWAGSGAIGRHHDGSVVPGVSADESGSDTFGEDCGHWDWVRVAVRGPCSSFSLCLSPASSGAERLVVVVVGEGWGEAQPAQKTQIKEVAAHAGGCEDTGYICGGDNEKREEGHTL